MATPGTTKGILMLLRERNYIKKVLGLNVHRKLADLISMHGERHFESLSNLQRRLLEIDGSLLSLSGQIVALREV